MEIVPIDEGKGIIEVIKPRKNLLLRPLIANAEQLLMVMSLSYPTLDFNVLDRLSVIARRTGLVPVLVLNKMDESIPGLSEEISRAYDLTVIKVSARTGEGLDLLKSILKDKLSILAGPSGVGKTSILNKLNGRILNPTGRLGNKIKRGRHTTRTSQFYQIGDGLLADTPGFSRVDLPVDMKKEELPRLYPEYMKFAEGCQFKGCLHWKEINCQVKKEVESGVLDRGRYERYVYLLEELKDIEERRYK